MTTQDSNTNENDRRQRANTNPDRPPVTADQPDTPDPFDPFKTAHLTDGGAVIQDETELTFQAQLNAALPTPDTPTTPTPTGTTTSKTSEPTETPSTSHVDTPSTPTAPHSETNTPNTPQEQTPVEDLEFKALADGSLLAEIEAVFNDCESTWVYEIQSTPQSSVFEHHAISNGELTFKLWEDTNTFYVTHESQQPRYQDSQSANTYTDFPTAIAAFIEGVDWGSLPPGNSDPQIWEYTGFDTFHRSFTTYLAGSNNRECGSHTFINTAADYTILIESYADKRPTADTGDTVTVVTLSLLEPDTDPKPVYRARFNGQKHAFETVFNALDDGLSGTISMHSGPLGDTDKIPPVHVFTQTDF